LLDASLDSLDQQTYEWLGIEKDVSMIGGGKRQDDTLVGDVTTQAVQADQETNQQQGSSGRIFNRFCAAFVCLISLSAILVVSTSSPVSSLPIRTNASRMFLIGPRGRPEANSEPSQIQEEAFKKVSSTVRDTAGNEVKSNTLSRGNPTVETLRLQANSDLIGLTRITRIRLGMINVTEQDVMGDFPKSSEPYEFSFKQACVPRVAPAGEVNAEVTFVASNIEGPLYTEHLKLAIV
jgi:hypothetical protein